MIDSLIKRIDYWLAVNRPEYYASLQPGASNSELGAFEKQFSLKLPPAFRVLYSWRNGQDPASSAPLQENRLFCSLEEIAEIKEMLDGMIGFDFEDPRQWRRSWVPFLHNGAEATSVLILPQRMAANLASSSVFGSMKRIGRLSTRAWRHGWQSWWRRWSLVILG